MSSNSSPPAYLPATAGHRVIRIVPEVHLRPRRPKQPPSDGARPSVQAPRADRPLRLMLPEPTNRVIA